MYLFRYSHLEEEMLRYFAAHDIDYTVQKTFPDLLSPFGVPLRFDAYIEKDGQPMLFECQGEQPYRPIIFFGGEETFARQKEYDRIKREYCKAHMDTTIVHKIHAKCSIGSESVYCQKVI